MNRKLFLLAALAFTTQLASAITFDSNVRYSKEIIDACIYNYKANTTSVAFKKYDAAGTLLQDNAYGKDGLDYVPGLVAKAVIEAVDYYKNESFAAPWFYSIKAYGNNFFNGVATGGGSLDDLNAVKLYFGLRELTKTGAHFEDATTASNCSTAIAKAKTGLAAHNTKYSISSGHSTNPNSVAEAQGGWWHKSGYINQMWCDGQYMGPALLAQIVAGGDGNISGTADGDWEIIAKQFTISWNYLWDSSEQLLWHAFCADGNATNPTSHAETWVVSPTLHSATYWGRAEGWYFLALIDVLEQMQIAGKSSTPAYSTLRANLNAMAAGLVARQDATSNCWYQLLGENGSFSANSYNNQSVAAKSNYLESSCSFLFAAGFLKGARLGLFTNNDGMLLVGKNAYEGAITRFWDGTKLIDCCASAGLGGSGDAYVLGGSKYRDGSKAYYLLGPDVTRITSYTEGKVLGASIMAAVEYERAVDERRIDPATCNCLQVTIK